MMDPPDPYANSTVQQIIRELALLRWPERRRRLRNLDQLEIPACDADAIRDHFYLGNTRTLGPYELVDTREPLGRGSDGAVYRAFEPKLGDRMVAVKVLESIQCAGAQPTQVESQGAQSRLNEARSRHSGLPAVQDHIITFLSAEVHVENHNGTAHLTPYIGMMLVEGARTITEACRAPGLPVSLRIDLLIRMCKAVATFHSTCQVHKDLKPDNIAVTSDNRVSLLDCGLDSVFRLAGSDRGVAIAGGTPGYQSPEQDRNDVMNVGPWSDVYSLGVIVREALCLDLPGRPRWAEQPLDGVVDALRRAAESAIVGRIKSPADLQLVLEAPRLAALSLEAQALMRPTLQPMWAQKDLDELRSGFLGRQAALVEFDNWLKGEARRHLVLVAQPGTGKSAFFSELIARDQRQHTDVQSRRIIAYHCVRSNHSDSRKPELVAKSIFAMLAATFPIVRATIDSHRSAAQQEAPDKKSLFDEVVLPALKAACHDNGPSRVIAIDAVDESEQDAGGNSALVEAIIRLADTAPSAVRLFLTCRSSAAVLRHIPVPMFTRVEWLSDSWGDIRTYVASRLQGMQVQADPRGADVIGGICTYAAGNFLVGRIVAEAVARDPQLAAMNFANAAGGLGTFYNDWMQRLLSRNPPPGIQELMYDHLKPGLQVMAAAVDPLPDALLLKAFGPGPDRRSTFLRCLGSLLAKRDDGWVFFHSSFRDWLVDSAAPVHPYVIDLATGTSELEKAMRGDWEADTPSAYTAKHLPGLLLGRNGSPQAAANMVMTSKWLRARLSADGPDSILADLDELLRKLG